VPRLIPRIAVTSGEPAGIGPDLALGLAMGMAAGDPSRRVTVLGDRNLLADRARRLGLDVRLVEDDGLPATGSLRVLHVPAPVRTEPGHLDPRNSPYVLEMLRLACTGCLSGQFDALVTAPVHKGVINDAGVPFSGHTEFLAELTGSPRPVMLLVAGNLRVALVTTHLPLRAVPDAVTPGAVEETLVILDRDLRERFGIPRPRIVVLGLNPHAGESGHLGREELEVIIPVLERLRAAGLDLAGPLPADTAFVDRHLAGVDAVLAMYHDQGLPVLKHHGFGRAVNVTLGLPVIRTSVDHGTALDLAGRGRADGGSLGAALDLAVELVRARTRAHPVAKGGG
jgi:4-hydroxythreonine-4-phosphate dehydrogenase